MSHWSRPEVFANIRFAGDVRPERGGAVPWLWPGRIPLGKLTLLVGDPGVGKSLLAADLAARVSAGLPWPAEAAGEGRAASDRGGDVGGDKDSGAAGEMDLGADSADCYVARHMGGVVMVSAEDRLEDALYGRLRAAGAKLDSICVLEGVTDRLPSALDPGRSVGAKMWITNGTVADVAVVWAVTDDGVRGFLVEKGTPGYSARDIEHKMSLRASITSELFFDNVRVPEAVRLPKAAGLGAPLSFLTQARYGIAWGALGAAEACFDEARRFAEQRVLFGRPLIRTQTIQIRLAEMLRRITLARLLAHRLATIKEAGQLHHAQVSLAKWNNVRMALDVAREARDILGAGGISTECSPIRHMLNLESVITYEGTETIHQLIVGREIASGASAF